MTHVVMRTGFTNRDLEVMVMERERPMREMVDLLVRTNGAIVCSSACSPMELAFARKENRFFVDAEGLGFVVRLPEWRANAESALQAMTINSPLPVDPA